jgi:hypothetical protein
MMIEMMPVIGAALVMPFPIVPVFPIALMPFAAVIRIFAILKHWTIEQEGNI